jgi:hypothetical protein
MASLWQRDNIKIATLDGYQQVALQFADWMAINVYDTESLPADHPLRKLEKLLERRTSAQLYVFPNRLAILGIFHIGKPEN